MSKVKIQGNASGSGVLTITAPNTSTDRTITLPDTTGTLLDENSSVPAANLTGTVADSRISALTASKLTGALPAISGASLTGLPAGGITEADQWRLTTQYTPGSAQQYIESNWARSNTTGFDKIGTGMSQSNGQFSFPSTGIWEIIYHISIYCSGVSAYIHTNINTLRGGGWINATNEFGSVPITGGVYTGLFNMCQFDVTNTSTDKVRFGHYIYNNTNCTVNSAGGGATNANYTYAIFRKLGET